MGNKVIPVERVGGGKILTPGSEQDINPLFELRRDFEEFKQLHDVETAQLRHDMSCQYDVLEGHIQDVERVNKAKLRDMIKCIQKLEKLVVEISLKT